jgi:GDP-4-dehydro-6-deoxy-D-mannose reductase
VTRNLVTGADGFVGQHLVAQLLRRGESVVGAVKQVPPSLTTLSSDDAGGVRWVGFDLEDRDTVRELVRASEVDRIFHLAGLASAGESLSDPVSPLVVNAIGTLFLFTEVAAMKSETGYNPTILISGSAQVYGSVAAQRRPLTEDCSLDPVNPYAVSKAAQEMLSRQFHRTDGLAVVITRSFNHIGPGQRSAFVAAQLAAQVHEITEAGGSGTALVGNPEIRRDFTDVRDVTRAYVALAEHGAVGEVYNVCSGRTHSVGELVEILADLAGVQVQVEADPERARPADLPEMLGSYARLAEAAGWAPEIPIRSSLADLLEAQRAR